LFNASAVSLGVVTEIALMSTEVIGVGERRTSVMVREPVTVMTPMSSTASSCPAGGGVAASCAQAELAPSAAETPIATKDKRKKVREVI
jgi:hypothetical protein